ncbi:tetratricopeptide repeat-containing sulfotransferase family protein [Glaciecola siphonariae]|uniref:Tetratricopeptide repeat-containing sulfotransferase family protein n=1 Tax=Glaciecola siphonariae TaxID=521012 RepID=A0ABV9LY72_9ALTE
MTLEQQIKQAISKGQLQDAINMAEQAIAELDKQGAEHQQHIALLYILAVATRLSGDLKKAIEINESLLALSDSHARAHQELAYAHRAMGDDLQSASHFYQATQFNPALLSSWKGLLQHYQKSHNDQAADLATAQINYLSELPKQLLHARDLMHEGQLHQADQLCRKFLQTHKHHPEGMLLLAEIGIALKVYADAEFLLESCLALHPEHRAAGIEYLKLLTKMGRFQDALDCANNLLVKHPTHPAVLSAKASALLGLGEAEQAIELYQQLLEDSPNQAGLHLLKGHAYKAAGQLEHAVSAYQKAYTIKADFGDAYWSLANTKTYSFSDAELEAMEKQTQQNIHLEDKAHFYFALGKALEDKQSFDSSFAYYDKGNAIKRAQSGYQAEQFEQQVRQHKQVFTKALFNTLNKVGDAAGDPIFIVGLPRSGSTLLEQILASHSHIDGTMELHNILGLASRLKGQKNKYPDIVATLDKDYFQRFGAQYIKDTRAYRAGAPMFIDKMPNNFLHIGLIKLILPNAKIIDARREPMACCFSNFKQLFAEGQEFTYGLENIGRYYKAYMDMMAHWNEVLPGFVLHVQHEDVINNLEEQVARMLDFCGLPFEQACVDFHKTKRTIKTPSSEQVRQPIFKDSMQQHLHYDKHLARLKNLVGKLN